MKTFLLNPFENYSEKKLLLYGIVITLIGDILGILFNGRFDGVLDLHFPGTVAFHEPIIDNLVAVAILAIALFAAGKFINSKTRSVDLFVTVMYARFPLYLLTIFNLNDFIYDNTQSLATINPENVNNLPTSDLIIAGGFGFLSLFFIVWMFLLLWNGFKVATNAKGIKHVIIFIIAIVVAEVISKIFISMY